MMLLLIGLGMGGAIGFILCAIRAGSQFDEGYRLGLDAGQGVPVRHRRAYFVQPPGGDWVRAGPNMAHSVSAEGWRVLEVEDDGGRL